MYLVLTFAFLILRLSGDPALLIMSPDAPPEAIEAFRRGWGLDAPLWKQDLGYFVNLAQGNVGLSIRDGSPAISLVAERIPATLAITVPAFLLKLSIGIPAGVYAALHRNSLADRVVMTLSVAGYTLPSFVLSRSAALSLYCVDAFNICSDAYCHCSTAVLQFRHSQFQWRCNEPNRFPRHRAVRRALRRCP